MNAAVLAYAEKSSDTSADALNPDPEPAVGGGDEGGGLVGGGDVGGGVTARTVTWAEPDDNPDVAVMTAFPVWTPVTSPLDDTVATLGLLELQLASVRSASGCPSAFS